VANNLRLAKDAEPSTNRLWHGVCIGVRRRDRSGAIRSSPAAGWLGVKKEVVLPEQDEQRSWAMILSRESAGLGWSLTHIDLLLCAMPISFFLSVVSFL
jgi:hypothetical protein